MSKPLFGKRGHWLLFLLGLGLILLAPAIVQVPFAASLPERAIAQLVPSPPPPPVLAVSGLPSPQLWRQALRQTTHFGHLPYHKAASAQLMTLVDPQEVVNGTEYLDRAAGEALQNLIQAAKADQVEIMLISGFRDLSTQTMLFRDRVAQAGSEAAAAKSVAPPGYSEHHTGYAMDLADAGQDFLNFGSSPAFRWMMQHGHEFGFELSFPRNNSQEVDYEPWHWRFVGSATAAQTFAAAEELAGAAIHSQ